MPRKTKAIKFTDRKANKPWLIKAGPSVYELETKEPNKIILVVCEGQSEKLYFESFPVVTLTVEAIDLGGQSKLKLIEATEEIVKYSEKKYDEIWCVFDMDVKKGAREFADFDNAITSGQAKGFHIAYSNDVFELWFYLHYYYTDHENHRQFYYEELGRFWNCNYEKVGKTHKFCNNIYERLENDSKASQEKAISRADKLFTNQAHLEYHNQNPVTLVYKLVTFLNENKRK